MEDWHFWVPTGISLASAALAAASWSHNRSAHVDKRFGEIAALRTDFIQRLTRLEERLQDLRTGLSEGKYGLRRLSDEVDGKYEAIGSAEKHRQAREDYEMRAYRLRRSIEDRPAGENSRPLLRALQLSEHELVTLEHGADQLTAVAEYWIELLSQDKERKARRATARQQE